MSPLQPKKERTHSHEFRGNNAWLYFLRVRAVMCADMGKRIPLNFSLLPHCSRRYIVATPLTTANPNRWIRFFFPPSVLIVKYFSGFKNAFSFNSSCHRFSRSIKNMKPLDNLTVLAILRIWECRNKYLFAATSPDYQFSVGNDNDVWWFTLCPMQSLNTPRAVENFLQSYRNYLLVFFSHKTLRRLIDFSCFQIWFKSIFGCDGSRTSLKVLRA